MTTINKIYLDFDGTIVNTIKAIIELYNEDFQYYKSFRKLHWFDINTWNFQECYCATTEYINTYFNQKRFFDKLEYIDDFTKEILLRLNINYEITIVSTGFSPNLVAKSLWISKNIPFSKFIGVNLELYKDKSHIDMSDGIFIDDSAHNLKTSNAKRKICFGDKYAWNLGWKGVRCYNWIEIEQYINEIERMDS